MHIHNLAIFRALAYLESDTHENSVKLGPGILNTVIARIVYSGIIQAYSEHCAALAYVKTWHSRNPGIFRTLP